MDRGSAARVRRRQSCPPRDGRRQARFLQTRGGNLATAWPTKGEYEVDQHQSVDDGVDPRHDGTRHSFPVLPPGPGDELGDIDVDDQRPQQEQPRVAHQDNPEKNMSDTIAKRIQRDFLTPPSLCLSEYAVDFLFSIQSLNLIKIPLPARGSFGIYSSDVAQHFADVTEAFPPGEPFGRHHRAEGESLAVAGGMGYGDFRRRATPRESCVFRAPLRDGYGPPRVYLQEAHALFRFGPGRQAATFGHDVFGKRDRGTRRMIELVDMMDLLHPRTVLTCGKASIMRARLRLMAPEQIDADREIRGP